MKFRGFGVLFLYEQKNKYNAAAAARNINAEIGKGFVNERTFDVGMLRSKLRMRVSQMKTE